MSIWSSLGEFVSGLASQALATAVESVRTIFEGDPMTRRQVGFSIAVIALSAKMAKADGIVTQDEVDAFRDVFDIPADEARNVARVYNLAKQDVTGYEAYARQVRRLFPEDGDILEDVLDGLFHIAKADGVIHELESEFLERVAVEFGISGPHFSRIRARHAGEGLLDAYAVLGADRNWDDARLKQHYRQLIRDNHPDRMVARGVPEEFLKIANERLAGINRAWSEVAAERRI